MSGARQKRFIREEGMEWAHLGGGGMKQADPRVYNNACSSIAPCTSARWKAIFFLFVQQTKFDSQLQCHICIKHFAD